MAEVPIRREPPPFRPATVADTEPRADWLVRVRMVGEALIGLEQGLPASSVRLLLPEDDGTLAVPTWNGNEFLRADGSRPRLRTVTPVAVDPVAGELVVDVVLHGDSPLSAWAQAGAGTAVAVSGTGRGYEVDPEASAYVVLGDESAVPAIATVLGGLGDVDDVQVIVEARDGDAPVDLGAPPQAVVRWLTIAPGAAPGDTLLAELRAMTLPEGVQVWAAGEAAGVQRIRKHLFDERGLSRRQAAVRGYWKLGRAEGGA